MVIPPIETLPKEMEAVLGRFAENISLRLGEDLVAVFLYGGVARGNFDPQSSNLNLLVVLREVSRSALDDLAAALPRKDESDLSLLTLAESELAECVEVFATKFFDIRGHHILLYGRDVLTPLVISPERLVRQARRELVNLKLRLRQTYLGSRENEEQLSTALERGRKTVQVNANVLALAGTPGRAAELLRASLPLLEDRLAGPPADERFGEFHAQLQAAIQALGPV